MAFNLSSPNYLDPRSGMPGNKPMQFLVGGAMGGNSQGFLGSTPTPSTSLTTTPKLDLLKVEKSPELNQTLKNLTADLNKLRTEQNTAADAFAKLNSELFTPDFLGRERAKFDLVPVTNQLAANTNQYRTAVNEGLGLALDRANRNADLSRLGQTAGGGSLGDSSYNRLLQGQMFREAATPFLGAVADRERADAMWLEQLKQAQVGRDLALTQAYLNQQAMPAQLRAQLAAQQAGLLGNYANIYDKLNFLGVGGQNPMSSPFIGASPNVPYYPAPSPARRGTGSVVESDNWIPEWMRRPPSGTTTNRTSPAQSLAQGSALANATAWAGLGGGWVDPLTPTPTGYNRKLADNPNYDPETSPTYGVWVNTEPSMSGVGTVKYGPQWVPYDNSGKPDYSFLDTSNPLYEIGAGDSFYSPEVPYEQRWSGYDY